MLVHKSAGIPKTKALASSFCEKAREAIATFPPSQARDGLEQVLEVVLTREK